MAAKDGANYTNSSVEEILDEVNRIISIELVPVMVFLGLLSLFGGIGNLLVCFVYYSRLRMSTQHFLIICLALFDLLTCFLVIPFEINDLSHYFNFTEESVCKTLRYVTHFCTFASILTLMVIAIDRYRKVCRPLKPQMTMRNVKTALVINLLLTIVLAIPAGVIYGIRTTDTFVTGVPGTDCSTRDAMRPTPFPLLYNSFLFVAFIGLTITLVVLYAQIWREMRRHNRYMARNSDAIKVSVRTERSSISEISVKDFPPEPNASSISAATPSDTASSTTSVNMHQNSDACASGDVSEGAAYTNQKTISSSKRMSVTFESDIRVKGQGRENGAFIDEEGEENGLAMTGDGDAFLHCSAMTLDCDDTSPRLDPDGVFRNFQEADDSQLHPLPERCRCDPDLQSRDLEEEEHFCPNKENDFGTGDDIQCERCGPGESHRVDRSTREGTCNKERSDSVCSCTEEHVTTRDTLSYNRNISQGSKSSFPSIEADFTPLPVRNHKETSDSVSGAKTDPHLSAGKIVTISDKCDVIRRDSSPVKLTLVRRLTSFLGANSNSRRTRRKSSDARRQSVDGWRTTRKLRTAPSIASRTTTKATIIAFSVTVVFVLSFLPHLSLLTARIVLGDFDKTLRGASLVFYNIFLRSYFVNSASNPIIYGVFNRRFRAECVSLFCYLLTFGRKQVDVSDSLSH